MTGDTLNIVIGGEAGQGLVTLGELLAKSLVRSGYSILVTQDYQNRVRGGHNTFRIRTGPDRVLSPREPIDLLVALSADTVALHGDDLSDRGLSLADAAFQLNDNTCVNVPYKELATGRYVNVAALGVVASLLGLNQALVAGLVHDTFGGRGPEIAEENRKALDAGFRWGGNQNAPLPKLIPVSNLPDRVVMNGNDAIALGAISAGLRFYAFYPMTPSTTIGLTVARNAEKMGLVVEQAEDEIAAINMALGASYAGAPSMTATSGGGFALMVESVSLAGITEIPIVMVVAQRPGPATGLPTRTEQGDLEFVLHAGHGEFPRAIFAPGTVEECFHLTRKAFDLAERYQSPVFILTDLFMADANQAVEPFEAEGLPQFGPSPDPESVSLPYKRYAITESGVSPRLLPGMSEHLVVTDSDEHDEVGHLTEDLSLRVRMVDKRLRKGEGLKGETAPPEYQGDDSPDLLLVTWGSTRGAVLEAASLLNANGTRTASLVFSQVWPLVPEQFINRLEGAGRVVGVEGNAFGQFARLIRRETSFDIRERVNRYDGLAITPEYILRHLDG
jgi:2-oxoglutarate ferredoxin oxidoreductase subunit alpha